MTDKQQIKKEDLTKLEGALKSVLDQAVGAQGVFTSIITEKGEAQTIFMGDDNAADAMIALLLRYAADSQEKNIFEKVLEIQTKLLSVHKDEFEEYAKGIKKEISK